MLSHVGQPRSRGQARRWHQAVRSFPDCEPKENHARQLHDHRIIDLHSLPLSSVSLSHSTTDFFPRTRPNIAEHHAPEQPEQRLWELERLPRKRGRSHGGPRSRNNLAGNTQKEGTTGPIGELNARRRGGADDDHLLVNIISVIGRSVKLFLPFLPPFLRFPRLPFRASPGWRGGCASLTRRGRGGGFSEVLGWE